jgi:hypothetical protein
MTTLVRNTSCWSAWEVPYLRDVITAGSDVRLRFSRTIDVPMGMVESAPHQTESQWHPNRNSNRCNPTLAVWDFTVGILSGVSVLSSPRKTCKTTLLDSQALIAVFATMCYQWTHSCVLKVDETYRSSLLRMPT